MEAFAAYLVKSAIWISAFTLVYLLFLKSERYFVLKRIYLISGIIFSFLFPLITIHYNVDIQVDKNGISSAGKLMATGIAEELPYVYIIAGCYILGIIVLIGKSFYQFFKLFNAINRSDVESVGPARLIRDSKYISSFSFFNYVFVNPSISEDEMQEVINHELVHVTQKHWFDLLLCELMLLLQWANPFMWIYTGFIRLNHEYIADELALQRSSDPALYKAALLNQVFSAPVISLSNSFNYSITKTRFDMMKKIIVSPYRKYKLLIILPVIAAGFYAFAEPEYNFIPASSALEIVAGKPISGNLENRIVEPVSVDVSVSPVSNKSLVVSRADLAAPDTNKKVVTKSPAQGQQNEEEEEIFQFAEELPEYPGGIPAILQYLNGKVQYPPAAITQGIQGQVTVRFAVAKDGSVKNVTALKGVHPLLDEEAIRVVSTLTGFKPGRHGGKPVSVWMNVPIMFKLH